MLQTMTRVPEHPHSCSLLLLTPKLPGTFRHHQKGTDLTCHFPQFFGFQLIFLQHISDQYYCFSLHKISFACMKPWKSVWTHPPSPFKNVWIRGQELENTWPTLRLRPQLSRDFKKLLIEEETGKVKEQNEKGCGVGLRNRVWVTGRMKQRTFMTLFTVSVASSNLPSSSLQQDPGRQWGCFSQQRCIMGTQWSLQTC